MYRSSCVVLQCVCVFSAFNTIYGLRLSWKLVSFSHHIYNRFSLYFFPSGRAIIYCPGVGLCVCVSMKRVYDNIVGYFVFVFFLGGNVNRVWPIDYYTIIFRWSTFEMFNVYRYIVSERLVMGCIIMYSI